MRRQDAGPLLLLTGLAATWASLSGAVLRYLRPGMRLWVGVAGAVLVVAGVAVTLAARRARSALDGAAAHHAPSRVGWLLALPLCVAVTVGAGSLGSYAVGRNATFRDLPSAPTHFDLQQYLQASSFGGRAVPLTLVDFVSAARQRANRPLLAGREVALIGFVEPTDERASFLLTRFVISCCAADASVVQVRMIDVHGTIPAPGTWVTVTGELEPRSAVAVAGDLDGDVAVPILRVHHLERTDEPDEPYEVPVSRVR